MNRGEYNIMRACEDTHWWYRALHRFLLRLLPEPGGRGRRALDVGCGTGAWLEKLAGRGYAVEGFDLSEDAVRFTRERGFSSVFVGDANAFPVPDATYDLVTCVDMLECREVDPARAVREVARVLKPGGCGILQMAAHQWLLSRHDVAVHSVRRYTLRQFTELLRIPGVAVLRRTHLFCFLFPWMAMWKLAHPAPASGSGDEVRSDIRVPAKPINAVLFALCRLESCLLPRCRLPMGTSVCAVIRRI